MNTVRLNITLPVELSKQLDKLAGPRKKSRFIAETLKQRIERVQQEQLQKLLEEGYKATRKEALAISREFEEIDLEGWDEY
jgi:metal-responsive CopG/Arc/MetJ family transcriptional regulator